MDFEEDANRTIRIRATDPYGEFIEKELVVSLTNVVEDIDGDGIEDAVDPDADGDGMNNEVVGQRIGPLRCPVHQSTTHRHFRKRCIDRI